MTRWALEKGRRAALSPRLRIARASLGGRERPKGALARLIAFARPRKAKAAATIMEAGSVEAEPESETALGKRGDEDAGADTIVVPAAGATAVANEAEMGVGSVGASNGCGQTPAASLCAQGRDRGRPHDGGRGGGDRGSELAASFASAGGGAGHARGSADEGDGAVGRVGDGSAEGGAKCRRRAAAGA